MMFDGRMDRGFERVYRGEKELERRANAMTIDQLAQESSQRATLLMVDTKNTLLRYEVGLRAKDIQSTGELEQYKHLEKLVGALKRLKPDVFSEIPDTEHEYAAFALALVQAYQKSVSPTIH